jgi:hypothetical protein
LEKYSKKHGADRTSLAPASPGKHAAADGEDMGARICAVGPNPTCGGFGDSLAPAAPTNLTVQ